MYARSKKGPLTTVLVRLRHEEVDAEDCQNCDAAGGKIDRFEREIKQQENLTDDQHQHLLPMAERCPVHRTLHETVEVVTRLKA